MKINFLSLIIISFVFAVLGKAAVVISNPKFEKPIEKTPIIVAELAPQVAEEHKSKEDSSKPDLPPDDPWRKNKYKFIKKNANISNQRPPEVGNLANECSTAKIELLKSLSNRRQELENWSVDAKNKENILKAAELKIDNKIEQLNQLKSEVVGLLSQYTEKENAKIKSLVKIYETMKPKDAAQIFQQLDMPVLLLVIDNMQESKVAPILANLDPQRAKDITIEFANQKRLPDISNIK